MPRHPLNRKHIVITGASDGIGRALAIDMAGRGGKLSLAARSLDKLNTVAAAIHRSRGIARAFQTDVSVESECRALIGQAIEAHGEIDVLVCNAGVGWEARKGAMNWPAAVRRTIDINFMGAV